MGVGDPSGTIRKHLDGVIARRGEGKMRAPATRRVHIDRTSSMTAAQVVEFWKEATRLLVEAAHHETANGAGSPSGVVRGIVHNWHPEGPNIDDIAEEALRKVFER